MTTARLSGNAWRITTSHGTQFLVKCKESEDSSSARNRAQWWVLNVHVKIKYRTTEWTSNSKRTSYAVIWTLQILCTVSYLGWCRTRWLWWRFWWGWFRGWRFWWIWRWCRKWTRGWSRVWTLFSGLKKKSMILKFQKNNDPHSFINKLHVTGIQLENNAAFQHCLSQLLIFLQ